MKHIWENKTSPARAHNKRESERYAVTVPARLTWKDPQGIKRFASVVIRDVSDTGVFVECREPLSIPLYRLVQFEVEPGVATSGLPESLRQGRVLTAVYRISHPTERSGCGLGLRLMAEPVRVVNFLSSSNTARDRAS